MELMETCTSLSYANPKTPNQFSNCKVVKFKVVEVGKTNMMNVQLYIAVGDQMFLEMQDYVLLKSNQICPNLINFAQKNIARLSAPTAL